MLVLGSGQAQGWGTAVECQDDACQSTTAAHGKLPSFIRQCSALIIILRAEYLDTTIILNAADSTFAGTLGLNEATSSGLKTTDNKIYTVSSIKIQSHTYNL